MKSLANPAFALALLLPLLCPAASGQGDRFITVSAADGLMHTIDPVTGTEVAAAPISTTAGAAIACNGLALDPVSGQIYVIVRNSGNVRKLAVLNPATAFATIVGTMSDAFAGIAFRADGVLFGVTGDGATASESLFTVNPANGQSTFVMALGNGTDGETIAFGADGFLYHCSGLSTIVFEKIDTFSNVITPIPLSGFTYSEMLSVTLWAGGNLVGMDLNDDLVMLTTNGVATQIGTLNGANFPTAMKGAVFAPSTPTQTFLRTYGFGCTSFAGTIPLLGGRVAGSPGSLTAQVSLLTAPPNAPGVIAPGTGNGSLPVPSTFCQIQINPFTLDLLPFTTDAGGRFNVNAGIPPGFPTGDIYLQAAMLDGANLLLSNPLQAHFP
jgi:hypothetical protein